MKYIIRHAKQAFNLKKIEDVRGDPKATWKLINNLRGKKKNGRNAPSFIIDGELVMNKRIIANAFNKYFVSLATKMNDAVYQMGGVGIEPVESFESFMSKPVQSSIFLYDCTAEEINKIISSLDNNKSSDIPIRVIKRTSHIISPILEIHFNNLIYCRQYAHISFAEY